MTLDEQFAHAALPARWRVFGRTLLPLAIGNMLVMQRLGSPFLSGGLPGPLDVTLALWIGSMRGDVAIESWHRPLPFRFRLLGLRISLICRFFPKRYVERVNMIDEWIRDAQPPGVFFTGDDGRSKPLTAPTLLHYIRTLMSIGYSRSEALAASIGEARWMSCANSEREGLMTFITDRERECAARNSARMAERVKN